MKKFLDSCFCIRKRSPNRDAEDERHRNNEVVEIQMQDTHLKETRNKPDNDCLRIYYIMAQAVVEEPKKEVATEGPHCSKISVTPPSDSPEKYVDHHGFKIPKILLQQNRKENSKNEVVAAEKIALPYVYERDRLRPVNIELLSASPPSLKSSVEMWMDQNDLKRKERYTKWSRLQEALEEKQKNVKLELEPEQNTREDAEGSELQFSG